MRCSNPKCRALTSGPHIETQMALNVGVAAHITAAAPGGPRYASFLSSEERSSIRNAIWLCQNCAKLVDCDEKYYTATLLREWKHGAETEALLSIGLPTFLRPEYSLKSNDHLASKVRHDGSSLEHLHWIDFIDSQLNTEFQAISFGPDIQKSLIKHRNLLQQDIEVLGFSMIPPVEEALTDLGRLQSISQSHLISKFPRLRVLCPISCLGSIAIFWDIVHRRSLPVELDLRFPDAIIALDYLENCSESLPDGLIVGIGPTLMPNFAKTMQEYLPVCIMPPLRQEFIYAGSQRKGRRTAFDDVKLKMHNRYTNLELHAQVFVQRGLVTFGRFTPTEPSQALQELVQGCDTSAYGLWGLWATTAKRLLPDARTFAYPYFSDTLLTLHRRVLTDSAPKVELLKDAIGESWIQLRHSCNARRRTITSLLRSEDFRCQFSKFFVYPFMDIQLTEPFTEGVMNNTF